MTHRSRGAARTLMETRRDIIWIKLAAGVLSVWGRGPGTLAMNAATLRQISGGRFVLGLGASTRPLVEGFRDIG